MATQHEIDTALNIVDRGARVALTVGERVGEDDAAHVCVVINLLSGCAAPKRIGYVRVSEAAALALCVQLGEALGL